MGVGMVVLIGRGEKTAIEIIKEMMPTAVIDTQVSLYKLVLPIYRDVLSDRQMKETIDIIVKRRHKPILCVRIQDKHHSSMHFGKIDGVQKTLLEWSTHNVVDIDENECPELFKEKLSDKSRHELEYYIKSYL